MIRDEFLKNDRGLSPKEIKGVNEMGERAYFSSRIMSLTNLLKTFNFSFIVILMFAIVATGILIYVLVSGIVGFTGTMIAAVVVDAVITIGLLAWFIIIKPIVKKKIKKYKAFMEEYNEREMLKNKKKFQGLR